MEIIAVICVFSICAAVCLNIFAFAEKSSQRSKELTSAAIRASEAAEVFKSCGGSMAEASEIIAELNKDQLADVTIIKAANSHGLLAEGEKEDKCSFLFNDGLVLEIESTGADSAGIEVKDGEGQKIFGIEVSAG